MAYNTPRIIVPANPAPLPPSYQATVPGTQSVYPGMWPSQLAAAPPVDTSPWPPTGEDTTSPFLKPYVGYVPPPIGGGERQPLPIPTLPGGLPATPTSPRPITDPDYVPRPGDPDYRPSLPPKGAPGPLPKPPGPKYWLPDEAALSQQLRDYLGSLLQGWQGQYRALGNTTTSWLNWVRGLANAQVENWITQNYKPPTGFILDPQAKGRGYFSGSVQQWLMDWLKQNEVNYTNPIRFPIGKRMQVPITDWTRLAGPEYGIASGFAEKATPSPWAAPYRGGAFGPTARTPAWMAGQRARTPNEIPNPW